MHPFFCEVVNYPEVYAAKEGYKVMLCNSNHQKDKEIEYIDMLKSNKVSGIVLCIRIPQDMKLVGFDDIRLASLTTPKISTIRQPIEQMCACAIDTLLRQADQGFLPSKTILPVTFIKREST